ncbi:hypothetical protein TH61_04360 [Rufibacter sp. DG15C]|uniref:hypothetical protein n=1 Tax=Rufibacter sp. DG15C TaxID=1379909 RepID=UPI00078BA3DB|nr:hypothetical protein [Rufibacter sp. DG15C]AMM50563.1 hypothetical protein TH61_04360 [Rufibacter sp. DG15C]
MKTSSKSVVNFEGSKEQIAKIKANGVTLPLVVEGHSNMLSTTTTGALQADQSFPAIIQYQKVDAQQINNGKETVTESPITGLIAKGKYTAESKFQVDTLISGKINDAFKKAFKATLESAQQSPYPSKPLQIGEKFEHKVPMSIPVTGSQPVKLLITTIYTLKEMRAATAIFDIAQTVQLDMSIDQTNLKASGSGKGVSEFDTKNNFTTKYIVNLDMNLTMHANGLTITTQVNSISDQQVAIKSL